jgi:hypothetical protein
VRTGEPLEGEGERLFHAGLGGLMAAESAPADATAAAWRVRGETIALLTTLGKEGAAAEGAPLVTVERANRLLASYARHVLGYETSTMQVLFGDRLVR